MADFNNTNLADFSGVWVFCEQRQGELQPTVLELISEARKLADDMGTEVCGLLLGGKGVGEKMAKELGAYGADKVLVCESDLLDTYTTDAYAKVVCDMVNEYKPEVLLMDEAFSALDPLIRVQMQDELLALQSKMKKTIVFITHDLEEAVKLGDRIAIMRDGEIQQTGTSEEILTSPANEYVRCFVENVDRSRIVTAAAIMVDKPMVARLGKEGPEVLTRKMRERKTTVLPVVDPDGILVGEVRLEDLLRLRKEHILHIDPVIKKEVHSVLSDTVVEDILPLMTKTNSPIWVVNEKREFEGMVPLASLIIEVTGKDRKEINEIIQNAIEL